MLKRNHWVKALTILGMSMAWLGAGLGGVGCQKKEDTHSITVGVIAGPEAQLMDVAKKIAKQCYGLDIRVIPFTDYHIPNAALQDGSLDANVFQHRPFLDAFRKIRYYDLAVAGKTFIYPMGIYSSSIKKIQDLRDGSRVAIPNDPSNEARALLLLQRAGLITLKPGVDTFAMPKDIAKNPKHLQFIALDAAQLPRMLREMPIAVINTNFAIPAGLHPQGALLAEDHSSAYSNLIVVRAADAEHLAIRQLVSALHSQAVMAEAKRIFGDGAIPGWDTREARLPCVQP